MRLPVYDFFFLDMLHGLAIEQVFGLRDSVLTRKWTFEELREKIEELPGAMHEWLNKLSGQVREGHDVPGVHFVRRDES